MVLSSQFLGAVAANTAFPGILGCLPIVFSMNKKRPAAPPGLKHSTESVLFVWTPERFSLFFFVLFCFLPVFSSLPPWPALYGEIQHFLKS